MTALAGGLGAVVARWALTMGVFGIIALVVFQCSRSGPSQVIEEGVEPTPEVEPNRIEGWNELLERLRGEA